jgi:hypothetical protein
MRAPSLFILLAPIVLLAGCATPETRLASGLSEAGLGKGTSTCLAREMADDLSLGQLIKLSKLGAFKEKSIRQMSKTEFLKATRALQDPAILKIATIAAATCAIG